MERFQNFCLSIIVKQTEKKKEKTNFENLQHITTVIWCNKCDFTSKRICSTSCSAQTPCSKLKPTQAQNSGPIPIFTWEPQVQHIETTRYTRTPKSSRQWLRHILSPMLYNNLPIFLCLGIWCILPVFWINVNSSRWNI